MRNYRRFAIFAIGLTLVCGWYATATIGQLDSLADVEPASQGRRRSISEDSELSSVPATAVEADSLHTRGERAIFVSETSGATSDNVKLTAHSKQAATPASSRTAAHGPDRRSPGSAVLSPEMESLRDSIRRTLATYHQSWVLNSRDHTPWEVMHAIVAFGVRTRLHRDGPRGKDTSAIGWLCFNGPCKRLQILSLEGGQLRVKKGPYVQGHHGQLLAMLAQSRLVTTYPMRVGGKQFTVADLIEAEKYTCEPRSELTFKLISLAHYLSTEETWQDERGEEWSISRLIAEEIEQPILRKAACGGTHRLMGLSYAVAKRRREGLPVDGQFARADKYTRDYQAYAFRLQNRDGSFSTKWFERPEAEQDIDRRVKTSGHILEWMVYSLPEEQLDDPRLLRAVRYMNNLLWRGRGREWEIGPLGHALHGLSLYHKRRFEPGEKDTKAELARREKERRAALAAEAGQRAIAGFSSSQEDSAEAPHESQETAPESPQTSATDEGDASQPTGQQRSTSDDQASPESSESSPEDSDSTESDAAADPFELRFPE